MEENKNLGQETQDQQNEEESSSFNFATIFTTIILNWKWFVLSLVICLGIAAIYLRYTTPIYQASAKLLIKDDDNSSNGGGKSSLSQNDAVMGLITNSNGIDNEMEILTSRQLAKAAVRDLKLNIGYTQEGRIKDIFLYKTQPITVSLDASHTEKLNVPINLVITRNGSQYNVTGNYHIPINETTASSNAYTINKNFTKLPVTINTGAGVLSLIANNTPGSEIMKDGQILKVTIQPLNASAAGYAGALGVSQTSK